MRRARLFSPFIALVLLAACGGTPSESAGGDTSQEPGASQPAASQPAASQGGGGGGGGGIDVTLSDGSWTGGSAQVTVSGDATADIDAPLQSELSMTSGGSTTLSYISSSSQAAVVIAIYTDSFAVSVTTADMTGGGGTTTTCDVTWHSTDDNNISADFSCPDSPSFTISGTSGGTIDIEGSFTATR